MADSVSSIPSLDTVAEWFLRLNGFFTILNFVVHPITPKEGTVQRTDADVLGIRFPGRREVVGGNPLEDHAAFQNAEWPIFVICEVKTGHCAVNGPWSNPKRENVNHVLRSVGHMYPQSPESPDEISTAIYDIGRFQHDALEARLVCFGSKRSSDLPEGVLQITWTEVFGFIFNRFQAFSRSKRQHQQWPSVGRLFWEKMQEKDRKTEDRTAYVSEMCEAFGIVAGSIPNE